MFMYESATLRTQRVLVVMGQYTRRIIGFGVHAGTVEGIAFYRMFNRAIRWQRGMPKHLSSDHNPLYRFGRWQANLRIREVIEIKTVPRSSLVPSFCGTIWEQTQFPGGTSTRCGPAPFHGPRASLANSLIHQPSGYVPHSRTVSYIARTFSTGICAWTLWMVLKTNPPP